MESIGLASGWQLSRLSQIFFQSNRAFLSRRISPDVLPSCSPGVFRQKSFRSSPPPLPSKVPATAATSSPASRNGRGAPASATNDRYAPRTATPAVNAAPNPVAAAPRDGGSRIASTASLSRGARAASKHARLGTALTSKMASASTSTATVVQGWPNTKDDYELKEVIGEYADRRAGLVQPRRRSCGANTRTTLGDHGHPRPRGRAPSSSPASISNGSRLRLFSNNGAARRRQRGDDDDDVGGGEDSPSRILPFVDQACHSIVLSPYFPRFGMTR